MKKVPFKTLFVVLSLLLILPAPVMADQDQEIGTSKWVIDDVITGDIVPFAIGHRGYGVNLGEDPDNPIENTTKSVRRAFLEGVQIVEVDANLTADNVAVALHDDYLADGTCINTLTFKELKKILPGISSLRQILKVSRTYSVMTESDRPSGQVVVEIKIPTPFCVLLSEEHDALQALVDAVLDDIRFTRMVDQVTIESFSPEILNLVKDPESGEPDIPRMLALDALQLLPLESIGPMSAYLYTVQVIEKDSLGLVWGEIAETPGEGEDPVWIYRLPGYFPEGGGDSFFNYIMTLFGTGSSIASLDKNVLFMAPSMGSSAASVVEALHGTGFSVLVFTIEHGQEFLWVPVSNAGVDGIFIDNIPAGLVMEGH